MEKRKIIMDVDTGTDDALALLIALLSDSVELLGVTTVAGNRPVRQTTDNTLRLMEQVGRHVPVYRGCAEPLCAELFGDRHGASRSAVLGVEVNGQKIEYHSETLPYPPSPVREREISAVEYLIQTLMSSEGEIDLVCVAPLTNLSVAMRAQPGIREKIHRVIIMGGGFASGNITGAAELNFWMDPEAAQIVLSSGCDITLVPLDATHDGALSRQEAEKIRSIGTKAAETAADLILTSIRAYETIQGMEGRAPLHDALALCAAIDDSVLRNVRAARVDVDFGGGICDGMSVMDSRPHSGKRPNASVALGCNQQRFFDDLYKIIASA